MLYIDEQPHIKSRADFFPALARAIRESEDLLKIAPGDAGVTRVFQQLEAIRTWTENGREPTKDERWKPRIGLVLTREFDSVTDPKVAAWAELSREVEGYFRHWFDDATYQTVEVEQIPLFAEHEDPVTHLKK